MMISSPVLRPTDMERYFWSEGFSTCEWHLISKQCFSRGFWLRRPHQPECGGDSTGTSAKYTMSVFQKMSSPLTTLSLVKSWAAHCSILPSRRRQMRHPIRLDNDSESFDFEFTDERAKACLIEVKTLMMKSAFIYRHKQTSAKTRWSPVSTNNGH